MSVVSSSLSRTPRVAIVHDALVNAGGAERALLYLCETFPDAPVFTAVYLPDHTYPAFRSKNIRVLPGGRRVRTERLAKQLFPLWVWGFARLALGDFDFVLSSTTFGAKHIRPPASVSHACYCYAPFRWLWKPQVYSVDSLPYRGLAGHVGRWLRPRLQRWDFQVMQRIPRLATTCRNMANEIERCYQRQARVIYVPVRLTNSPLGAGAGDYYLSVSRLVSHKRVDLAVEACRRLDRPLIVVGDGPELPALRAAANSKIKFSGRVTDTQLAELYANCRALLFPSNEDYGLAPLEAQAAGRPVIAYGAGGVLETVVEGETGLFFPQQTIDAVIEALNAFERMKFDPRIIRQSVERFGLERFKAELREFVLTT